MMPLIPQMNIHGHVYIILYYICAGALLIAHALLEDGKQGLIYKCKIENLIVSRSYIGSFYTLTVENST